MLSLLLLTLVLIGAFVSCMKPTKSQYRAERFWEVPWQSMSQKQIRENDSLQQVNWQNLSDASKIAP